MVAHGSLFARPGPAPSYLREHLNVLSSPPGPARLSIIDNQQLSSSRSVLSNKSPRPSSISPSPRTTLHDDLVALATAPILANALRRLTPSPPAAMDGDSARGSQGVISATTHATLSTYFARCVCKISSATSSLARYVLRPQPTRLPMAIELDPALDDALQPGPHRQQTFPTARTRTVAPAVASYAHFLRSGDPRGSSPSLQTLGRRQCTQVTMKENAYCHHPWGSG